MDNQYAVERVELEKILTEKLGNSIHNMAVKMYNIYDDAFAVELRWDGNLICNLCYETENDDVYVIPFIPSGEFMLSEALDSTTETFKYTKKVFLYSELILMSKDILDSMRAMINNSQYKKFIKKYR